MTCAQCGSETVADGALCPACAADLSTSRAPTVAELQATPVGPFDAHGAVTAAPFAPGQRFGDRYTIVEEVGAGGMGHVYKAIDRDLGKTVALKLVRPAAAGQGLARERFRRELSLAQAVTHPNVCRVHDLGEVEGALYISMEFVEGQTLDDLIQSVGHLSAKQTVALGRRICAGLQAIPRSVFEAAAIDGARPMRRFWTVTFPLLSPTIFFLLVVNIVYAFFDTFGIIDTMTRGGPGTSTVTLVYKVYSDGLLGGNLGSSAAQSVILMVMVIVLTGIQFRFVERKVTY